MKEYNKNILSYILLSGFVIVPKITLAQSSNISKTINEFYNWALGIGGMAAVIMIVVGGIYFSVSGVADKKNEGKKYITSALWGLVLLFGAFLVLNTVNPQITELQPPSGPTVEGASCSALEENNDDDESNDIPVCEDDQSPYASSTDELVCCVETDNIEGGSCNPEEVQECNNRGGVVGEEDAGSLNTSSVFWCENSGDPLVEPSGCNDAITWMSEVSESRLSQQHEIYLPIEIEEGGGVAWKMFYPENTSTSSAQCGIWAWRTSSSSSWEESPQDGLISCE